MEERAEEWSEKKKWKEKREEKKRVEKSREEKKREEDHLFSLLVCAAGRI